MERPSLSVAIDLLAMQKIVPFIIVVDQDLTITWVSQAVERRSSQATGGKLVRLVEFVYPSAVNSREDIMANLGLRWELKLLSDSSALPLSGRWLADKNQLILFALPDIKARQEIPGFSLDVFKPDDSLVDLYMVYGEYLTTLKTYSGAVVDLDKKSKAVEEISLKLEATNESLEKEVAERQKAEKEIQLSYLFQTAIKNLLKISLENDSLEGIFTRLLEELISISWLDIDNNGLIFLTKESSDFLELKAQIGAEQNILVNCAQLSCGECLCGKAAKTKKIIYTDETGPEHSNCCAKVEPHGHYCVPILTAQDKRALGVINLRLAPGHKPAKKEQDFYQSVANVLAGIIKQKRAEAEVQQNYDFQIFLNNLFHIALENHSLGEMLKGFIYEITSVPWLALEQKGAIFLVDETSENLVLAASRDLAEALVEKCALVPFGKCLCGKAAQAGEILFTDKLDERHEITYQGIQEHGHYCVPIKSSGKTKVIGIINLYTKAGARLSETEEHFLLWAASNVLATVIKGKQAEEELRLIHMRNARLLAAISSILIGVDDKDQIIQWNKAAEEAFGIEAKDAIGKLFPECGIQWDWRQILKNVSLSIINNIPARIDEFSYTDSGKREKFLNITISVVNDTQGEMAGFYLLGTDITQSKLLGAQLAQAQKLESIGQLAAGIAHEINTPMQFISDNTNFLKDSFGDLNTLLTEYQEFVRLMKEKNAATEEVKKVEQVEEEADAEYLIEEIPKAIEQTMEGIGRVSKIVRAMKEFSHPDGQDKKAVAINQAIENTVTVARNEWKYVAEMKLDLAPDLPLVPCLVGEFNQVILNIIVNAAHAIGDVINSSPEEKGMITISTREAADRVEIRISDTGSGIPPEIQSKIFDPFFTTKEVGRGTGQGLALAHAVIVEKHQGTLTFESVEGQGTTFIISLPLDGGAA